MAKGLKYRFLEHTADAKFQAFGKDLEECFSNAALAMTSVMMDYKKVKSKSKHKIRVKGTDMKNLLYNFLEEILFLVETKNFILSKVEKLKISKNVLVAELVGDDLRNYEIHNHIKAVTYNEMEVEGDFVQVVVDI